VNRTADAPPPSRWQSRWPGGGVDARDENAPPLPTNAGIGGWTGLVLAVVALWGAAWIFLPPPDYFLLRFAVGAPELCVWIGVLAIVAIVCALGTAQSAVSKLAILIGIVALVLAETVLFRLPATIRELDTQGGVMLREPASPLRAAPVSALDLFRGVVVSDARITRGITFATPNNHPLTLDVYRPQNPGRFPIVVQIHGGSWRSGDASDYSDFAQWLTGGGYVVFSIDYRLAPHDHWPAQLADIDTALAWINAHAGEYEADTTRVVLLGRSAGAHLAMMAAYEKPRPGLRGVVSFYGPIDLAAAYRNPPRPDPLGVRDIEEQLIGGPLGKFPREYADASPMTYASSGRDRSLPPTLLINGARDNAVEAKYARVFAERLNESGTPAAYLEIPWAEHAFDRVFSGVSSQLSMYYVERFLAWADR
jgi:acetyl esterase/lipase